MMVQQNGEYALPIVIVLSAIFGAAIGSFLNVVIHRVPRRESIIRPRSRCPQCGALIGVRDNIPILSFLILRGRCRRCRSPIPFRYLLVEALTAILFVVAAMRAGLPLELAFDLAFIAAIVALIFIDAEHMLLPNAITYPGFIGALIARILVPQVGGSHLLASWPAWALSLFGGLIGAAFGGGLLWVLGWFWRRARGIEAMGLGDVKMMMMVGAYLGLARTAVALFLAFLIGAVVGVALLLRRRERDWQMMLPFGIFLGIGALVSLFFGEAMLAWYLSYFD
ncbi:type 4 prepilin peptidase 1 [Pyrinomonas methylaliphatogenes]|uniref:Type 4 prepilin peptidase 1 n=2 Tax=Pyrinomonas methylaliphatogenes TaxID=454194 RepID=A0A0B6WYY4_9BACT|nr:type 4 prepilin peptidase 1 [Pyrinomonas methylaliphatogenes]